MSAHFPMTSDCPLLEPKMRNAQMFLELLITIELGALFWVDKDRKV